MTGTGTPGLAACGQTRSRGCAQSGSRAARDAEGTWAGRTGRGRACCRRGRWTLDFCNKEGLAGHRVRQGPWAPGSDRAGQDAWPCSRTVWFAVVSPVWGWLCGGLPCLAVRLAVLSGRHTAAPTPLQGVPGSERTTISRIKRESEMRSGS